MNLVKKVNEMIKNTSIFAESWNVAFRNTGMGTVLEDIQKPFVVVKNNIRYWAADPFIIEHNGEVYIFAELYDYILCRGIIGYCKLERGKASKWIPVIKEDYHLSYPCIIRYKGKLYIMPESGEGNELSIYEAAVFPDKWEKRKVIRENVKFADTTPFPSQLSTRALTHCVDNSETPKLMLIDLTEESKDVVLAAEPFRSRPAGNIFVNNDKLIRPAQFSEDCGSGYGKGLIFYQCCFNGEDDYDEIEIKTINPEDLKYNRKMYLDGMHTYNASEHYEVVDIKTRRLSVLNLFMRIINKFIR